MRLKNFHFYAYLFNEYAKEEQKKMTDLPTFHRVLLRKSGEYLRMYVVLVLYT